ncbi:MAG: Na+/H+ antiporter NhaA [Acidiferrobacterales bacterium]|nr:Na+/H+ antiporter NhaA [Acidiferrobacterales bacterium]
MRKALTEFIRLESAGGILLLCAAMFAMLIANSPLADQYALLLNTPVAVLVGELEIHKPLLLWINDGLMAIFFFLIGLEIKREFVEGELSSPSQIVLPALGAAGGMVVPAGIYIWMNWGNSAALEGWAIPVATDIAFALGLLSVFGTRVPTALKVFLLTLAIFDDLAAIIIIALFYSGDLSVQALWVSFAALVFALIMNKRGIKRVSAYVLVGIILWVAVLKSGVHATLAGVLIALCVPMRDHDDGSPLRSLEHDLHGPVAYGILPVFALANAGIALGGVTLHTVTDPVTLGVIIGLVVGKPIGVMLFVGAAVILGMARLPQNINWWNVLGVAFACGIGFTMSLFIAGLAFDHGGGEYYGQDRMGILIGSVLSAIAAYVVLNLTLPKKADV